MSKTKNRNGASDAQAEVLEANPSPETLDPIVSEIAQLQKSIARNGYILRAIEEAGGFQAFRDKAIEIGGELKALSRHHPEAAKEAQALLNKRDPLKL